MNGDFLDTNVFIYVFDPVDSRKRAIARTIVREALDGPSGTISYQVVQETLNVITRRLTQPVSSDDARAFLHRVLVPLWRVMPSAALYEHGLELRERYQYSLYDSLIVAAALEAGCSRLLSEDLSDGQRIDGLTIENPFAN